MDELVQKIKSIQNKQKSLMWGTSPLNEEILFAVGNKSYPREPHFFLLSTDLTVFIVQDDNSKLLLKHCDNNADVINCIIKQLKNWFPAKGLE